MKLIKSKSGILRNPANSEKILEMTADTMFLLLRDGTCVDLVLHTDTWFLQDTNKFIGKNIFDVLPSETSIALRNNFEKVASTSISSTDNYEMQIGEKTYFFKCIINNYDDNYILCQYRDITKRILLKQNLEKTNKQLQEIEKVALIGHWKYNTSSEVLYYKGFIGVLSNSNEYRAITKSELMKLIHPDDKDVFNDFLFQDNRHKTYEVQSYRLISYGKTHYMRFRTISTSFENGTKILEGYVQNITDIKENQHKLEMVTQAVSNSSDYIFAMMTNGEIIFGNQRFKEIHDWNNNEKNHPYNILDSKTNWISNKGWMEIIHQVTSTQQMVSFIMNRLVPEDQTTQSFDCTSYLIKDSTGMDLVWTFGKEITERVHYEKQVKELNQIMSTVLSNIPMFISVKDVSNEFRYIFSNCSGGDFRSGLTGHIIGKTDFEIFPGEIAETMRKDDIDVLQNHRETRKTIEDTDENGNKRLTDQLRILIKDDFRPLLITIEKDITKNKQMEQELVIAKEKAEQSDKLKSAFIANMSHEIRTPLNAIVGFSRIMAETSDEDERKTYNSIVENNNERLLEMINEILDLSKIESGIMEFESAPLKMSEFGEDIMNTMSLKCPKGVELIYEPSDNNKVIICDRNRLFQVFVNLINNSIKFTTEGSIRFGFRLLTDCVEFFVKDTGKGIAPDKLGTVFDRFVKADNITQGTGLGLSICKSIIERMGGTISVSSEIGKGTCFTFQLPECNVFNNISEKTSSMDMETDRAPHDWTVLVAEDTDSNFKLIEAMIGKKYKIVRAENGIKAISLFRDINPDLILMDIKMPEMNGLDATQIIRKSNPDIPIIAQSAFAFEEDRKNAIESGCTDFIAKPFTRKQLTEVIDHYLNR